MNALSGMNKPIFSRVSKVFRYWIGFLCPTLGIEIIYHGRMFPLKTETNSYLVTCVFRLFKQFGYIAVYRCLCCNHLCTPQCAMYPYSTLLFSTIHLFFFFRSRRRFRQKEMGNWSCWLWRAVWFRVHHALPVYGFLQKWQTHHP